MVMATNIMKTSLVRVPKRTLAAQAAPAIKSSGAPEIDCSVLPNKMLVSSLDLCGPLSRVSVIFRTGSRNETSKTLGASHVIRAQTGNSTHFHSGFAIVKNVQEVGAYLSCTGDREITSFNLVAQRGHLGSIFTYLTATASAPIFYHWELDSVKPRLEYEMGALSPQIRTFDILHKAAFRTGLGNSIFLKKDHLGNVNTETMCQFFKQSFTANRCAVVGYNVAHKELLEIAGSLSLGEADPPAGNGQYFGGEIRKDKNSSFSTVAVGLEGVGLQDLKSALSFGVLKYALGSSPKVSWGGSPNPLYKAVNAASADTAATSFNVSYSDNGIFGVILSGSGLNFGRAVEAAVKVLKSGTVSDADIARGKNQLKARILNTCEDTGELVLDIGAQSLLSGLVVPGPVLAEAVDKLTAADIQAAAKKVAGGKLSLAGFGNLTNVPHIDQLK